MNELFSTFAGKPSSSEPIKPELVPQDMKKFAMTGSVVHAILQKPKDKQEELAASAVIATQKYIPTFKKATAGPARARLMHKMLDQQISSEAGRRELEHGKIGCKKGCSYCCYLSVAVSDDEADLLAMRVKAGVKIDMDLLKHQACQSGDPDDWITQSRDKARCVFLGNDGICQVYEDRPGTCRNYFVISDPEMCNTDPMTTKNIGKQVMKTMDTTAEYILAAGSSFQKTWGTLPQKLWARLVK